jgi:hypothetical protein
MIIKRFNDIGCLGCDDKVIQFDDEWISEMAKMPVNAQKRHYLRRVVLPKLNRKTNVKDAFSEYYILRFWLATQP